MGCGCLKSEIIDRRIRIGRTFTQTLNEEEGSKQFSDATENF